MKVIIHKNETGGVSVVFPADNCGLTVEEIALKDVPTGVPFKIIDDSALPDDHTFFNAWTVDESTLTDGVGA